MDCEKALELMSAELDGMCTEQERAALQAHLEACADCRETYRQLRALDEALQDAELEPPQALHDNVMQQIRKEKKPARRVWLPAAAIAAAAALVLLAGQAGILSLPGFDRENSVTVNVGSAAERIFERIEPEAASRTRLPRRKRRRCRPGRSSTCCSCGGRGPRRSCARRRMRRRRLARGSTA